MKSHNPKLKKSAMAREAERIFQLQPQAAPFAYEPTFTRPAQPVVVHTFTTYSVCEDPIPNPSKKL
jgi:hypothetical protein